MKTSGEPALIKERACNQLGNAIHHLEEMKANREQKASAQLNKEVNQRMDDMEKNIQSMERAMQQMSEMVTETSQTMGQYFKEAKAQPGNQNSTYAEKVTAVQMNQGGTTINNGHQNTTEKIHQHREKLRKLRQETEVVLTTKGMSEEHRRKIKATEHNEIREICQKAIEQSNITGDKPKVLGVNKLTNGIRLQFKTKEDVEKAKTVDWNSAYQNLALHSPKYGIVIHGIPKTALQFDDDQNKAIEEFEQANEMLNIKVVEIKPLRRHSKPSRSNHSIVVFTEDASAANRCIDNNVIINHQIFPAEKYAPQTQITQCLNCYDYGHFAAQCKKQLTCGRCSNNHPTNDCTDEEPMCKHCKGSH
jgi:hypothetical protein